MSNRITTFKSAFTKNYPDWSYDSSWDDACVHYWPCNEIRTDALGADTVTILDPIGDGNIAGSVLIGPSTFALNGYINTSAVALSTFGTNSFVIVAAVHQPAATTTFTYGLTSSPNTGIFFAGTGGGQPAVRAGANSASSAALNAAAIDDNIWIYIHDKDNGLGHMYAGATGEVGIMLNEDISALGAFDPTDDNFTFFSSIGTDASDGVYGIASFSFSSLPSDALTVARTMGAYWLDGKKVIPGHDFTHWKRDISG